MNRRYESGWFMSVLRQHFARAQFFARLKFVECIPFMWIRIFTMEKPEKTKAGELWSGQATAATLIVHRYKSMWCSLSSLRLRIKMYNACGAIYIDWTCPRGVDWSRLDERETRKQKKWINKCAALHTINEQHRNMVAAKKRMMWNCSCNFNEPLI